MTIYILTIDGKPEQTTESLDHATLWRSKGKDYDYCEKFHYDSECLAATVNESGEILIDGNEPGEYIAQVIPEFYYDEGFVGVGRCIVDFFNGTKKNLDDLNLTDSLRKEIDYEVDVLREKEQENCEKSDSFEAWMDGN